MSLDELYAPEVLHGQALAGANIYLQKAKTGHNAPMPNRAIDYRTLNRLMVEKEKSQQDLAKATGVSQSAVSRWLSNDVQPQPKRHQSIADFFGVTLQTLYGRTSLVPPGDETRNVHAVSSLLDLAGEIGVPNVPLSPGHLTLVGLVAMLTPDEARQAVGEVYTIYHKFLAARRSRESETEGDCTSRSSNAPHRVIAFHP